MILSATNFIINLISVFFKYKITFSIYRYHEQQQLRLCGRGKKHSICHQSEDNIILPQAMFDIDDNVINELDGDMILQLCQSLQEKVLFHPLRGETSGRYLPDNVQ